jgi:hypothetical protein
MSSSREHPLICYFYNESKLGRYIFIFIEIWMNYIDPKVMTRNSIVEAHDNGLACDE